jgi:hypothetical protein
MNRTEWKAHHRSLRSTLRRNPKSEHAIRELKVGCRTLTIRVGRGTAHSPYHELNKGLRITDARIRDRPISHRCADEAQWIAIERRLAMRSKSTIDKRAYRAGIQHQREVRLGNA